MSKSPNKIKNIYIKGGLLNTRYTEIELNKLYVNQWIIYLKYKKLKTSSKDKYIYIIDIIINL